MNYSGIDINGRSRVYIQVFIQGLESNAKITVAKEQNDF